MFRPKAPKARSIDRSEADPFRDDNAVLQQLIDLIPTMIFAKDERGVFRFANKALADVYGTTPEELLGQTDADFNNNPSQVQHFLKDDREVLKTGTTKFISEEKITAANGQTVWLQTTKKKLAGSGAMPDTVLGVSEPITDRRRAEQREQELMEQLGRAEKMESLGVLAGGIAHDLNNLLSPLLGYPDIVRDMLPPDSQAFEFLEEMKRATKQAADMIQDLLTLARRGTYKSEAIAPSQLFENFRKSSFIKKLTESRPDIKFSITEAEKLPAVDTSGPHFVQILMNLVRNAFEAIEGPGKVSVDISTQPLPPDLEPDDPKPIIEGPWLVITIADTGTGISKRERKKIFEPFYSTKAMGSSGTGLGLAIVYGLIMDMNGYLDLQSQVGMGTTFTVYLPASTHEVRIKNETVHNLPVISANVLVIDDLPSQRKLASMFLEKMGCKAFTAESGQRGFDIVRKEKIDLVLIDMILGDDFDGLDTYMAIQKHKPGLPCMIVSGFAETDRIRKAIELGAVAYIKKPYTMELLAREVGGVLLRDEG